MRKLIYAFAAGAVAVGMALAGPASAQSLDEVLDNYYEAIGGVEGWKDLQTLKASGKMVMGGMGVEAPFTVMTKRPGMSRVEFEFQGMKGIQAYDGETAWMVMPFMGSPDPEVMSEDMAQNVKEEADIDGPLIGWKEDGHQVELLGKESVEGTEAYKLKVTLKNGNVNHYYLDAEYHIPIKMTGTREMQGQTFEVETSFSDYKEVGGLLMPHSIAVQSQAMPGGNQVITIETIETGIPLEDSLFQMPETEETSSP